MYLLVLNLDYLELKRSNISMFFNYYLSICRAIGTLNLSGSLPPEIGYMKTIQKM